MDAHEPSTQELQDAARCLERLRRVTSTLSEAQSFEELNSVVHREVSATLDAAEARIHLRRDQNQGPLDRATPGHGKRATAKQRGTGHPAAREVLRSGEALWLGTQSAVTARYPKLRTRTAALAALPLRVAERSLGVITLDFTEPQPFPAAQRALIRDTAQQVALTLERAQHRDTAEQRRRHEEQWARRKDQLLALLAHELRSPLSAIRSAASLLKLTIQDEKAQRAQLVIERQATELSRILNDVSDASQVIHGQAKFERQPVDVKSVIQNVLRARRAELNARNIELRVDVGKTVLRVLGDRPRLEQVFEKLLQHAMAFAEPPRTIAVCARAERECAVIRVRDSGPAVDARDLERLFDLTEEGAEQSVRAAGTFGLDLAVAQAILTAHAGHIRARSGGVEAGVETGVEFEAWLPLAARKRSGRGSPQTGARILVVEDHADTADTLRDLLETVGHKSAVAASGEGAMDLARSFQPEVVFCDIGLPGRMSGYDVARALRADDTLNPELLVALTGHGQPEDIERARDAGFDIHLTKPFDLESMQNVLAALKQTTRSSVR